MTNIPAASPRNFPGALTVVVGNRLARLRTWAFLAGIVSTTCVMAAGGHHAIDDAAIMDTGACKLESWWSAARGGDRLLHAGGGCRVGPVELNASGEHTRAAGASETSTGLQMKWATDVAPALSAGLSLAARWDAHGQPRHAADTLVTLFTWSVRDDLGLHLNLGRDFVHGGPDENRGGVQAEWKPRPNWSFIAERYLEAGTHFLRGGVRWALSEGWSVDLSRAQRLRGPGESNWTIGATWQFERP